MGGLSLEKSSSDDRIESANASYRPDNVDGLEKSAKSWQNPPHIDPAVEKRITRKFDTHVVPWLFGLWLLAFIDRKQTPAQGGRDGLVAIWFPLLLH